MVVSDSVEVDTHVKQTVMCRDTRSLLQHLRLPYWDAFMQDRVQRIFERGGTIIDIGGGLRIDGTRGNREDPARVQLYGKYLSDPNVRYKVTDYTNKYAPDYVEDIHNLSFETGSIDGIFCIATLQHVYDPIRAAAELERVLTPGGMAFVYAPFMYRYHGHKRDYRDYYRFSKDAWGHLFRNCGTVELCPVRGLFESLLRFTPLTSIGPLRLLARLVDRSCRRMRDISEVQTSGYNVFLVK